jgi:two-component sensor histidine kinase
MMVNEDDKARAKEIITKALATHKPYQINYRICTAEGKLKWVWEQGRGVYSDKGDLVATEGFVTDITEKKLFEEEILKKNNELSALYHFGKSLSKLAEPAMIIDDIGTMLGKLFNSPNIYLALFNEAEQSISYPFYLKEGKRIDHGSRPFANAFTEFVIKSRKGVFLNENVKASLTFLGITGSSIEAKSLIAAPMTAGEKVLGVITIQDFNNENSFTQSQLELLTTVGSQAAIALENSYLYLEVTKQLREKEVLLQEVHHRVKNNLQVMSSLIKLQARYIKDDRMLDVMKETGGRIQSMAIVHTKLYNSGDYEFINFGEYVKSLTENFQSAYGYKLRNVRFNIDIDNIIINIDTAIPCGLIINELISNSIKYAFPEDKEGEIGISLARTGEGKLHLKVKDNGEGVDDGIDLGKAETLGIQLVTLLTRQMNGTMEVVSTRSNGTEFNIIFEEAVYKARK